MGKYPSLFAFTLFIFLFGLSGAAFAQGTTSRITGTVTDSSGAAVSGATVTLTDEGTNTSLTTQTSDSGAYTFDLIQPGKYTVSVEKQGFKKLVSTGNTALINQPATVNVALEIGDVSATITVESTAEQVQTSSSGNIGSTVEQRTLESLPIVGTRGRNPLDLLNYQPGVVSGSNTGGGVHVNGSRDRSFNFTLDGIDINESSAGGSNFTPLRPNPDSIQEFQVVTSGFTAELGRSSGAQVTFVTRSGTNEFRGNIFEYYQTPRFMARSYAANVNNAAKEQFVQHIFGGSFGGPLFNPGFGEGKGSGFDLLKDKAFFFVNLQFLRASDTALATRTVYTSQARQGIFRWVRGSVNGTGSVDSNGNPFRPNCSASVTTNCVDEYNIATRSGISLDPRLMGYINAMPLPNNFQAGGDGLNIASYVFSAPQQEKQYDLVTKFDFKLNDNNSFYVRYAKGEQNTFGDSANGGRPRFPDSPNFVDTFRYPENLAINWRWSPTAKFTNEFIVGLNRFGFDFVTPEPDPNYTFIFNLPTDINTNFSYNARRLRTWQFVDNITYDLSPHIFKAGVNIRLGRQVDDRASVAGTNIEPTVNFGRTTNNAVPSAWLTGLTGLNATDRTRLENTINDMLGRVGNYSRAFVSDPNNPGAFAPAGTRWIFTADYPELDFYVQDSWRWRPNFTIDLGVRMEAKLSPSSADGRPVLRPNKPFTFGSAPANDLRWEEGKLFDNDYLWMPSVGFAWDPFNDGKTSIRANYRMASDRFGTQMFAAAIWQNAPGNTFAGSAEAFLIRNGLPDLTPSQSPSTLRQPQAFGTGPAINAIDPDLKFPRIHSWTLSFQREIWDGNVVEVNYIGKKGTNLFGGYNANQVNINASVGGYNFLEEFNKIKGSATYVSPLIGLLFAGSSDVLNPAVIGANTRFRALNATGISQGSVAALALAASQKTCLADDIAAGVCTSAQSGQRLLDLRGYSSFFQPYSQFTNGLFVIDSNDYSFYNGVEFIFKRRIKNGLGFQMAYTWALSKDSRSFDPVFTTVATGINQTAANTPFDNRDRTLNYSWSDFDRRHSFLATYVYELPFGKGKWIGSDSPSAINYLISGWQLAGGLRLTSGRPFTVFSGINSVSNSVGSTANCNNCPRDLGSVVQGNFENPNNPNLRNWFFDQEARLRFSIPNPGEQGNTPRNYFIGPSFFETDVSLSKKFKFTERLNFDLRVDVKNLTNTPNFNLPSAVFPSNNNLNNSLFGRINADVVNNARRIQFSGKINF